MFGCSTGGGPHNADYSGPGRGIHDDTAAGLQHDWDLITHAEEVLLTFVCQIWTIRIRKWSNLLVLADIVEGTIELAVMLEGAVQRGDDVVFLVDVFPQRERASPPASLTRRAVPSFAALSISTRARFALARHRRSAGSWPEGLRRVPGGHSGRSQGSIRPILPLGRRSRCRAAGLNKAADPVKVMPMPEVRQPPLPVSASLTGGGGP